MTPTVVGTGLLLGLLCILCLGYASAHWTGANYRPNTKVPIALATPNPSPGPDPSEGWIHTWHGMSIEGGWEG